MANYSIPPWLAPVSPVQPFLSGVSQGADIAGQQNRMELAIQEMTLRREAQQRHDEAQQLAAARTVQDMAAQQAEMQRKAQQEARKWQRSQEMNRRIAAGEDPMSAYEATLPMADLQESSAYFRQKAIQKSAAERQATIDARAREHLDLAKQRFEWEKTGKSSIPPSIIAVKNPITGKDEAIAQLGGRSQLIKQPLDTEQKQLNAIEDESLKNQQRQLEKSMGETMDPKERGRLEAELLKVKTARTNLVTKAKSAPLVPEDVSFETPQQYEPQGKTIPTFGQPLAPPPSNTSSEPPHISTKEERDALPPGAVYIWKDGKPYRKQ